MKLKTLDNKIEIIDTSFHLHGMNSCSYYLTLWQTQNPGSKVHKSHRELQLNASHSHRTNFLACNSTVRAHTYKWLVSTSPALSLVPKSGHYKQNRMRF
jgi:hypothetical protein